jgi:hypothetical protein
MKRLMKYSFLVLLVCLLNLFFTNPASAVPTLPSSFYGTVKFNNSNVPLGTQVQALINGQVIAEGSTQIYQGGSVYALDVPGDDTDTAAMDGGREGDLIQFKLGGILAAQSGLWHTGTNVQLDLTVSSSAPLATPMATLTPVPTQTPIPTRQPTRILPTLPPASPTPVNTIQSSPVPSATIPEFSTPTPTIQPVPSETQASQVTPVATTLKKPSNNSSTPDEKTDNGSSTLITVVVVSILGLLVMAMVVYEFINFQK